MIAWRATWQALAGRGNVGQDAILANLRAARLAAEEPPMGTWKDEIGRIVELHGDYPGAWQQWLNLNRKGAAPDPDLESVAAMIWYQMVAEVGTELHRMVDVESGDNTYRVDFVPGRSVICSKLELCGTPPRITGSSECLGDGHLSESSEPRPFCKHRLRVAAGMLPVDWRIDWDSLRSLEK